MAVSDYNANPALNVSISGIDVSEGSAAAGYNDALRQIMADIAAWTQAFAVTYPIAVNKGGTGAATAADALTNLGALAAQYQYLPQSAQSAAFTLTTAMNGGHVRYTGAGANASIAPNATQPFPIGAVVVVVNDGSGTLTFVRGTGVASMLGTSNADHVLAVGGIASLLQVATDRWVMSGSGLS